MTQPFALYPLSVGKGQIALCPLPGRTGDMDADMATLAAFAPALVISLTEPRERANLGAATLPDRLAQAGLKAAFFPIPDFGIPDAALDWPGLSHQANTLLNAGKALVIHCHGGLGRSGMIALRLMIEQGEDPAKALTRLRVTRPGAVETNEQERWATKP